MYLRFSFLSTYFSDSFSHQIFVTLRSPPPLSVSSPLISTTFRHTTPAYISFFSDPAHHQRIIENHFNMCRCNLCVWASLYQIFIILDALVISIFARKVSWVQFRNGITLVSLSRLKFYRILMSSVLELICSQQ